MAGLHRKRKRDTTADDYAAMLGRMLAAYGKRVGADPAASLPHLRELEQALTDSVNAGIWQANKTGGHSVNELADILGVSKQAIFKRVSLGEQAARQREQARRTIGQARTATPKQLPQRLLSVTCGTGASWNASGFPVLTHSRQSPAPH